MDIFQVLAEPRRREIVEVLASRGRLTATAISKQFKISPPAISQHLKALLDAEVVKVERSGRERIYAINPASLAELQVWVKRMTEMWEDRFSRLDAILEIEKSKLKNFKIINKRKAKHG